MAEKQYTLSMKEYTRSMADMRGIDATSDASAVSPRRFSFLQNMYKDYKSGQGLAVETFPGTRTLADFGGGIHGIHHHKDGNNDIWVVVHAGTNLFRFKMTGRDDITDKTPIFTSMNERRSSSFVNNNRLYIIDGANYLEIDKDGTVKRIMSTDGGDQIAYIPTTYSDGVQYEQRNMLTDNFMEKNHIISLEPHIIKFGDSYTTLPLTDFPDPDAPIPTRVYNTMYVTNEEIGSITGRVCINNRYGWVESDIDDDGEIEYTLEEVWYSEEIMESVTRKAFSSAIFEIRGNFRYLEDGREVSYPNLREIILPDGVEKLDDYFFSGTAIEEVTLPRKLKNLGWYAFKDCDSLKTIYASDEEFEDSNGAVTSMYNILRASLMSGNMYSIPEGVEIRVVKYEDDILEDTNPDKDGTNRVYLYTPCKSIAKVEFDGEEILDYTNISSTTMEQDTRYYRRIYRTIGGNQYIIAIELLTLSSDEPHNLTINGVAYPSMFKSVTQAYLDTRPIEDMEDKSIYGNHDYEGTTQDAINNCTICTTFDDRIFFTGNPYLPNTVFYTQRDLTGHNNATYIGALNWFDDGVSGEPNVAMMSNATTLMVLKGNTIQDGSIYYHTGADGENDLVPRIYPSVEGLAGLGCVGLAVNFRDDCVFLSRQGLEGISKQTVNLERTIQHRSTNIDGLMLLYGSMLKEAKAAEWEGYLCILMDGKMFLADSRQMFEGIGGAIEYEWYYIDPVGAYIYDNQKYILADWCPEDLKGMLEENEIEISDAEDRSVAYTDVKSFSDGVTTIYYIERDGKRYLVDSYGELEGGDFDAAQEICAIDDVLLLGTGTGKLLCVNTDKRGKDGAGRDRIPMKWYNNSGHAYDAVAVFSMDNAGVPHYTKTTVKRGTVLRLKAFPRSSIEIYATTDKTPTTLLTKQSNSITTFDEIDFANLGLLTTDSGILAIKEKTKKWVEKQYRIIGREYNAPWGFYSLVYRYTIQGEVKNK